MVCEKKLFLFHVKCPYCDECFAAPSYLPSMFRLKKQNWDIPVAWQRKGRDNVNWELDFKAVSDTYNLHTNFIGQNNSHDLF